MPRTEKPRSGVNVRRTVFLSFAKIRLDGGTQPRAKLDGAAIEDYTDAMLAGMKFPPIVVFYDGTDYWLADGFHRRYAAFGAEASQVECDVFQGTREDAQWYSLSANKTNGLRRTNEDKQRAVKAALAHPLGVGKSDSIIARHCGVDAQTVANWRVKLEATSEIRKSTARTGADGRTIKTSRIGGRAVAPTKGAIAQVAGNAGGAARDPIEENKRQLIREKAAYRKMVDCLSYFRGMCRGLQEIQIEKAVYGCPPEERKVWVHDLRKVAKIIGVFASEFEATAEVK